MKQLKNWDNKTWLSSNRYILFFCKFLKKKIKIDKKTRILDVGCGRANIISFLQKKYKFRNKPVGIDVIKNDNTKNNIIFKRVDAVKYLKKSNQKFDLILIKQTIHFFSKTKLDSLLDIAIKKLNKKGHILIFSLKTKNNQIPSFKRMKIKLILSLKKDENLIKRVKKKFNKYKISHFDFKVSISKSKYIKMIKNRYISCLLNLSRKEIKKGVEEFKSNFKNQIKFTDTLICINYKK
ncbi:class I SAM-dependent methyltransferase [Pelagibacterales bacterium SAG-MED05]|nr:class I SAM-dependent methyltransferase [Pelagibacterales bacterium SAG-MED05]